MSPVARGSLGYAATSTAVSARAFGRRCPLWRLWRGVGVGEREVERVGLFLDLGREGRGARIAVAGGDEAFRCRCGFCAVLRREFGVFSSRVFLKVCLGFGDKVFFGRYGHLVFTGPRSVVIAAG